MDEEVIYIKPQDLERIFGRTDLPARPVCAICEERIAGPPNFTDDGLLCNTCLISVEDWRWVLNN